MAWWHALLDGLTVEADAYYRATFESDPRFSDAPRLLNEFAHCVEVWSKKRDAAAARGVQEKVNELAAAAALLSTLHKDQTLAYEPPLSSTKKTIDFCVMSAVQPVAWIDVKTVSPEWRDLDFEPPRVESPPEVKMIRSQRRAGAGVAGGELNARLTFLRRTIDLEKKAAGLMDGQRAPVAMLFCTNGSTWKLSALAEYAYFYRTGSFRPDYSFGDAISKSTGVRHAIVTRTLAGFHFLERRQFDAVQSEFRSFVGGPSDEELEPPP